MELISSLIPVSFEFREAVRFVFRTGSQIRRREISWFLASRIAGANCDSEIVPSVIAREALHWLFDFSFIAEFIFASFFAALGVSMSVDVVVLSAVDAVGGFHILVVLLCEVKAGASLVVRNITVSRACIAVRLDHRVADVEAGAVGPVWTSSRVNWAWYVAAILDFFGRGGGIGRAGAASNVGILDSLLGDDVFHVSAVAFVASPGRVAGLDAVSHLETAGNGLEVANIQVVVFLVEDFKATLRDCKCLSSVWLPLDVRRRFADWFEGASVS